MSGIALIFGAAATSARLLSERILYEVMLANLPSPPTSLSIHFSTIAEVPTDV